MRSLFYDAGYRINILLDMHSDLPLSRAQASRLAELEREWDELPRTTPWDIDKGASFGTWEELDYRYWMFEQVLDLPQLKKYSQWHRDRLQELEQEIAERDIASASILDHHNELISYCTDTLLPNLTALGLTQDLEAFDLSYQIDYLKAAYVRMLEQRRAKRISEHLRENRAYAPNGLRLIRLEFDLEYLHPLFPLEMLKTDAALDGVVTAEIRKLSSLLRRYQPTVEEIFRDYDNFRVVKETALQGQPLEGGWHTVIFNDTTDEQVWQNMILKALFAQQR